MVNGKDWIVVAAEFGHGGVENAGAELGGRKLLEYGLEDRLQNIPISLSRPSRIVSVPSYKKSSGVSPSEKLKNIDQFLRFREAFEQELSSVWEAGLSPIVVGGDHSISLVTHAVATKYLRKQSKEAARIGLLWVDAHADINTPETSPSGNIHGMSVAALLGMGDPRLISHIGGSPPLSPENLCYLGLRSVDDGEKKAIVDRGIKAFSISEVDYLGMGAVCDQALRTVTENTDGFILSFDLDVCDPKLAPAVGTPVRGGLTFREVHLIMEQAAKTGKLLSVELVEFNPLLDQDGSTGELAIGLLESALGKTIL